MSFDALSDLNWLAVIVAALAYFAIGAVWYAPSVFGKAWMAAGGLAMPEAGTRPSPAIYLTPLIGSVLSAVALGMLAKATGTDTLEEGIALGLVVAIGFAGRDLLRHRAVRIREAETDGLGRRERRVPRRGQPRRRDHRGELAVAGTQTALR